MRTSITRQGLDASRPDISTVFHGVIDSEPTGISSRDKGIGDAAWEEYLEETDQKPGTPPT